MMNQKNLKNKVNLILQKCRIIIKPADTPRKGWENAFKEMHENGEDNLLMDDVFEDECL